MPEDKVGKIIGIVQPKSTEKIAIDDYCGCGNPNCSLNVLVRESGKDENKLASLLFKKSKEKCTKCKQQECPVKGQMNGEEIPEEVKFAAKRILSGELVKESQANPLDSLLNAVEDALTKGGGEMVIDIITLVSMPTNSDPDKKF